MATILISKLFRSGWSPWDLASPEVNLLLMAAQLQYHGFVNGHAIGYPRYATNPEARGSVTAHQGRAVWRLETRFSLFFWVFLVHEKKWRAGTQKILTLSSNVKTTSQSSARFPSWFLSENRWFFWLSKPELNFNNCDCPVVIFCPDGMAICCWHFLRGRCFVRFSFHRGAARKKNSWSSPGRGWRVICGTWQARFIAVECDRHQNQKEHIASAYLTVRHGIDGPFIDGLMFTY